MVNHSKISFYPGPSQVYPQVGNYLQDAIALNVTGYNHRSSLFTQMVHNLTTDLFGKLQVPVEYKLAFACSATEVWGSLANSFKDIPILNFYNGSFGEKWSQINTKINSSTVSYGFGLEEELNCLSDFKRGMICICQNETSNATQVSNAKIAELRQRYPDAILAVDATSSMGGIQLDFKNADIWFASVQKCFGLPAGLSVVLLSPKVQAYFELVDQSQYNNVKELYEKASVHQTIHTPNVLGIYLLSRLVKDMPSIVEIDKIVKERSLLWQQFFRANDYKLLVENPSVMSDTVFAIHYADDKIQSLLQICYEAGFVVGKGYGAYSKNTFRIANFPALRDMDINGLMQVLKRP